MKTLWTEKDPEFDGEFASFGKIAFEPRCLQEPHVPVWIGGSGSRAVRRAVELGDGWAPMQASVDELAGQVARMRQALLDHGRSTAGFTVSIPFEVGQVDPTLRAAVKHASGKDDRPPPPETPAEIIESLRAYADADVDHVVLNFPWRDADDYKGWLRWFAAEVMPEFPQRTSILPSAPPAAS